MSPAKPLLSSRSITCTSVSESGSSSRISSSQLSRSSSSLRSTVREMARSTVALAGLMNAQLLAMITRPITLGTPVPISARTCSSLSHEDRKNIDAVFARANDGRVLDYASQYAAVICNMVSIGTGIGIVNPFVTHHFRNLEIAVLSFLPTVPFHSPILFPNSALATLLKRHLHKVYASFQASDEHT